MERNVWPCAASVGIGFTSPVKKYRKLFLSRITSNGFVHHAHQHCNPVCLCSPVSYILYCVVHFMPIQLCVDSYIKCKEGLGPFSDEH